MKRILISILVLVLTAGLLMSGCSSPPNPGGSGQAPQIGKPAPDFNLQSLDGQSVSLSGLRGKPVLINFWATWCPPCRIEMPYIQQVYDEWADKGLAILAIDVGESPSEVRESMESRNLSFPVLLDTAGDVALQYNVRAIPTTLFLDKDGILQTVKVGAFSSKADIEKSLSKIIP